MGMTLGGIPAEDIRTIRTNGTHYSGIHNLREIVDRHIAYLAFEHDEEYTAVDKGKVRQEVTVRIQTNAIVAIEACMGEPIKVNEAF